MKTNHPLSLRLAAELHDRLEQAAQRLRIKKHTLAQESIAAVVAAIERNEYRVFWPLECNLTASAAPKPYPPFRDQLTVVEESAVPYGRRVSGRPRKRSRGEEAE